MAHGRVTRGHWLTNPDTSDLKEGIVAWSSGGGSIVHDIRQMWDSYGPLLSQAGGGRMTRCSFWAVTGRRPGLGSKNKHRFMRLLFHKMQLPLIGCVHKMQLFAHHGFEVWEEQ